MQPFHHSKLYLCTVSKVSGLADCPEYSVCVSNLTDSEAEGLFILEMRLFKLYNYSVNTEHALKPNLFNTRLLVNGLLLSSRSSQPTVGQQLNYFFDFEEAKSAPAHACTLL